MATLSFTQFLSLPRCQSGWASRNALLWPPNFARLKGFRLQDRKWCVEARKKIVEGLNNQDSSFEGDKIVVDEKKNKKKKSEGGTTKRTRKKAVSEIPDNEDSDSDKEPEKAPRRTRKKAVSASSSSASAEEGKTEKKVRGRRKTKEKDIDTQDSVIASEVTEISGIEEVKSEKKLRGRGKSVLISESEESDSEDPLVSKVEEDSDAELNIDEGEDISSTYGWPPLVCCFGAAQHAFVPSGRPANRLLNYEIHDRMKEAYWAPEKFVRAPGGSAGSVAIALATLGGKVAFMGKLGSDDFGEAMLYYMNFNSVQTRSVKIDSKQATAVSHMRISKRGQLRATCVKPCSEDSLTKSEINIDVLKQTKMLYCSTHSQLNPNMRSTTFRAIKIAKKLGSLVFYDVNLPMPLWRSSEEAWSFIQQAWNLADIIEVTKQELEFLCGITPSEEFDTRNNDQAKFVHYEPEVFAHLWHENLKVLFVTNGTSKIHYYTKEFNGSVKGMEDPPLTPSTSEMSASGDGIIAGMLRLLTVQLESITDQDYLEHIIRFAINCGVTDQWALGRAQGFPPRDDMEDEVDPDENGLMSLTEREFRSRHPVTATVQEELEF